MQNISLTGPPSLIGDTTGELGELFHAGTVDAIPNGHGKGVNAREGRLKNLITPLAIRAIEAAVYKQDSWYDGEPCIVLDYSKTSFVAQKIRDEIREIAPGVFLGLVFWGRRHVLDFALDFRQRR